MLQISKFIIGIILIPVVIGISQSLLVSMSGMGGLTGPGAKLFLWGAVSYVVMHLFIFRLSYVYTFGHEMTHVVTTWISGGGVKSFNVSKEGGSVQTTKSNTFINLAPYFIPTYSLAVSVLYFVIPLFFKLTNLSAIYFFLMGFTLTLHLVFTAEALKIRQPDIIKTGYIFSIVIIYIVNVFLVAIVIGLLFKGISIEDFFYTAYIKAKHIYASIIRQLFLIGG